MSPGFVAKEPKERPILFTRENVVAIRDGRKTETRRIIEAKQLPTSELYMKGGPHFDEAMGAWIWNHDYEFERFCWRFCPYGVIGGRLWVKESVRYRRYGSGKGEYQIAYDNEEPSWPTLSGRFLMRRYARLFLEVTNVRVQRLHDIDEADATKEGCEAWDMYHGHEGAHAIHTGQTARAQFIELWDRINRKRTPWASNPWVWVITFKRITK